MWNGIFSPTMQKRVGRVIFLPLDRMTNDDWNWLDWDNIRNTAKNRLAAAIMAGLVGFLDVRLDDRSDDSTEIEEEGEDDESRWGVIRVGGRAKRRYLYGATGEDEENFEEDNHDFFRHEAEEEEVSEAVEDIEDARAELSFYARDEIIRALRRLLPQSNSRGHRALNRASGLNEDNFTLFAAVMIGIIAFETNESYNAILSMVTDSLDNSGQLAAGRGLTGTSGL